MITRIVYPSALEYWLKEKGIPYQYWNTGKTAKKKTGRASITETVKQLSFTRPFMLLCPVKQTDIIHLSSLFIHYPNICLKTVSFK